MVGIFMDFAIIVLVYICKYNAMDNNYTEHCVGFDHVKQCEVKLMCQFRRHLFGYICGSVKLSGSNFDDLRYDALKRAN